MGLNALVNYGYTGLYWLLVFNFSVAFCEPGKTSYDF